MMTSSLLLFLLFLSSTIPPGSSSSSSSSPNQVASAAATPEQCQQWGFDSTNLACETCSLLSTHVLPARYQPECLRCCQKWRPSPALDSSFSSSFSYFVPKLFASAALFYEEQLLETHGEDLKNFIAEDAEGIQKAKGSATFQVVKRNSSRIMMKPPLLKLRKQNDSKQEEEEVIDLRGWKREDIRDMLMAVLPDAKEDGQETQ